MVIKYYNTETVKNSKRYIHSPSPPSLPPFWETSFNSCGSTYSQGNSLKISWAPCKQCMSQNLKINQKRANTFSCKVSNSFSPQFYSSTCPALQLGPQHGSTDEPLVCSLQTNFYSHLNTTHWKGL